MKNYNVMEKLEKKKQTQGSMCGYKNQTNNKQRGMWKLSFSVKLLCSDLHREKHYTNKLEFN